MNEKELAEIEARAEAATPGPWEPQEGTKYLAMGGMGEEREYFVMRDGDDISICCDCSTPDGEASPENANFIAHARQDVPALVAEVRRLQIELTEITEDRDSENRWAKTYFDHWNASRNYVETLRAALEASEKVCKIISEYMSSGEFFDPETSKAIYEWQALTGDK